MSNFIRIFYLIILFLIINPSYINAASLPPNTGPEAAGLNWIQDLIRRILQLSIGLAFVTLVVVLVTAGIKYLTSGGEAKALQSANMTVTWALLGMLILAVAWLVLLLIEAFTGLKLSIFDIKILCGPTIFGPAAIECS